MVEEQEVNVENNSSRFVAQTSDVKKLETLLYSKEFTSYDQACDFFSALARPLNATTRTESVEEVHLSDEGWNVFQNITNAKLDGCNDWESVRLALMDILKESSLEETSTEFKAFETGIDMAISVYNYRLSFEPQTRGFWSGFSQCLRCVGGTAGSAGLGFLAGAGVGTVTLPLIGTVSGAAMGGYSGALVGAATFC